MHRSPHHLLHGQALHQNRKDDQHIGCCQYQLTLFSTLVMMWKFGKPDPSMMCNGMLAALVAITAPYAFVNSLGAVIIGAVAGVLVVASVFSVERVLKLDDPVGAISMHGTCGSWGVLSVGILANGSYGQGWGGVHKLIKRRSGIG